MSSTRETLHLRSDVSVEETSDLRSDIEVFNIEVRSQKEETSDLRKSGEKGAGCNPWEHWTDPVARGKWRGFSPGARPFLSRQNLQFCLHRI